MRFRIPMGHNPLREHKILTIHHYNVTEVATSNPKFSDCNDHGPANEKIEMFACSSRSSGSC